MKTNNIICESLTDLMGTLDVYLIVQTSDMIYIQFDELASIPSESGLFMCHLEDEIAGSLFREQKHEQR
jgi:hypothetical protein